MAVSCAAHDLLDRNPLPGQREDGGVCLLPAQVALVLQLLGKGQKRRIDHRSSHCRPDLTHGLANCIEKGLTDLRLLRQPGLSSGWLPIRQESDRRMPLKVADKRAVAVIAPPRPVIDADNRRRRKAPWSTPAHHAQQRVVAHLDVEPARKGGSRSASKRNGETVDHIVEAARTSRSWFDSLEAFGKDPPLASRSVAEEAAGPQNQRYSHPRGRKIRQSSSILTVHAATNTFRTSGIGKRSPRPLSRSRSRHRLWSRSQRQIRAEQAPKHQTLLHGSDPLPEIKANPAPRLHQTSKLEPVLDRGRRRAAGGRHRNVHCPGALDRASGCERCRRVVCDARGRRRSEGNCRAGCKSRASDRDRCSPRRCASVRAHP